MTQIGIQQIAQANQEVATWAAGLAPGLPFLTLYGQAFALFLLTVDPAVAWKRAFLHDDERSDDCESLCADCQDTIIDFTYAQGTGPASVAINQEFVVTPSWYHNFGDYGFIDITANTPCTIQWIERDLVARSQDGVAIAWNIPGNPEYRAGVDNGQPFTDFEGLAAANTHKGEQHVCSRLVVVDGSQDNFTFKLISIP